MKLTVENQIQQWRETKDIGYYHVQQQTSNDTKENIC